MCSENRGCPGNAGLKPSEDEQDDLVNQHRGRVKFDVPHDQATSPEVGQPTAEVGNAFGDDDVDCLRHLDRHEEADRLLAERLSTITPNDLFEDAFRADLEAETGATLLHNPV